MIPAADISGMGVDPSTLVTDVYYQYVTQTSMDDTTQALPEAIDLVTRQCNRTLAYGQYTERLEVFRNGYVYPSAVPFDPAQTMTPKGTVQSFSVLVGSWQPIVDAPLFLGTIPPQTDFTYWGGFQPVGTTGGPTPGLPPRLARAICKVAWYSLHPVALAGLPAGVKSASVGDVSVSGASGGFSDLSAFMAADSGLCADISAFRRPADPAWQPW